MSQFLEVLEHYDPTGEEIAFRLPPEGSAEIKFGAQLVVHEAQEAVFYRDGRSLDLFGPGRHTLTTQNVPVLTKALSLPFGFTSPFRIQVVFVSKRTFLDQKWGTRDPVVFRDRELGVVRLRAFGTYAYRIADARTFVNTVVGSLGQFDTGRLQEFYRHLVVARLNDLLGETLTSILDLPASYDELAALAKARLRDDFGKYGVDLSDFYVASVTPPDEVLARLDERASMGVSSHTASLAGDYEVFSAVLSQYGLVEARDQSEMISACEALSCYRKPIEGRMAILTGSGGHGAQAMDGCLSRGLTALPFSDTVREELGKQVSEKIQGIASFGNPVDLTGSAVDDDFVQDLARYLSKRGEIDCLLLLLLPYLPGITSDLGARLSMVYRQEGMPMVAYVPHVEKYSMLIEGFQLNGLPVARSIEEAVQMAESLRRFQRW